MTTTRIAIGLAALTFIFYLLWSKGFSPQWVLYLIAFLCILLPTFLGTVLIALLEVVYVIEWPITFILLNADPGYLTAVVFVRTAYIVGLALFFGAIIFTDVPSPRWETAKCWAKLGSIAAVLSVALLALAALPLYAAQRYQADPMRQAVEVIKDQSTPDRANLIFDRVDTAERLAPFLPGWSSVAALQLGGKADDWSEQKIQAFSSEKPEAWYVLDFGAEQKADQRQAIDRKLSETLCKVSREFAGSAQVSHFVNAPPDRDLNTTATFANGLQLDRARISNTELKPGDPICLELQWSTTTATAHRLHRLRARARSKRAAGGAKRSATRRRICAHEQLADRAADHRSAWRGAAANINARRLPDRHRSVWAGWRAAHIKRG